jgi:hypothetical protein
MRDGHRRDAFSGGAIPWPSSRSSFLAPPRPSIFGATDENSKNRVWKLPQVWKHRTLPQLLGNHRTVSTSCHTPHRFNRRGSILVSEGGQKILSLDNTR